MKKIPFFVLVFSSIIFSQFNRNNPNPKNKNPFYFNRLFYSELYNSTQDSNKVFFIYKIPINILLFEKSENIYKAKFRVALEIFDPKTNIIQREFDEKNVSVKSYESTKSISKFAEGIIILKNLKTIQKIIPTYSDVFSNREFKGRPINVNNSKIRTIFSPPIIVKKRLKNCKGKYSYELANYGGSFPFSENKYEILLPVKNLKTDKLFVKIKSNGKTIFNKFISESFTGVLDFKDCDGKVVLKKNDTKNEYQFFILNNIEDKLPEGPFQIQVSTSSNFINPLTYSKKIIWFDKPLSLRNTELAIRNLKYVADESVIDDLLDNESFLYAKKLQQFWKKFDPTPNSTYNPIMKEYYQRIDYSMQHFTPISRKSGANTDRGKIYIKYGKPSEVKRISNTYGQVTEIWLYKKANKEFVFIDKYGIGDFSLVTG